MDKKDYLNNPQKYPPGMLCPQCGELIPVTKEQIVYNNAIVCPHCNLYLKIDRQKSSKAIDALKKLLDQ